MIAALALLGALLHVGVFPQHALMQIAAAAPLSESEKWAIDNNIPICHAVVTDEGRQQHRPGRLKVTYCVICASALTGMATHDVPQLANFALVEVALVHLSLDAESIHARSCAAFEARGPPAAA